MSASPTTTDTVVVGAGQAGLALSSHLTRRGHDHVLLERGRVAQAWHDRWDSLTLLSPNWMNRLPGVPFPGDPDGFVSRTDVIEYLQSFAGSFRAPVVEGVEVLRVTRRVGGFRVETTSGTWHARTVVVATGDASDPFVPFAAPEGISSLHASAYRRPGQLPAGPVLIVGAGATGQQLALELRSAGRDVMLAVGRHSRAPRRYRGRDIFAWLDTLGDFDRTVDELPDVAAAKRVPLFPLSGANGGEDLGLDRLAAMGVTMSGRLERFDGYRAIFADDLAANLAAADARLEKVLRRIDAHPLATGDVWRPDPVVLSRAPRSVDLTGFGAVVWATGFRRAYPWLQVGGVLDEHGELVQRLGATHVRGLYTLGLAYQQRRSSHFIGGVGRDAGEIASRILARRGRTVLRVAAAALALIATLLLLPVGTAAAKRPRPNEVAGAETAVAPNAFQVYNDYASPERTYAARRAVVHYVVLGIDAPPLNDDDASGVPDYVERVGEAADRALDYYERRGFRAPRADEAGPDSRPDLYVTRFAPGTFGVAFPAVAATGGAFAAVGNNLDPSAGRSFASLSATVAHEIFHLVQFAYFPPSAAPEIPTWILEGTAAGLEARVEPDLDDLVSSIQLRPWLAATGRSITTQSYGAQLLWQQLDVAQPRLLPELFRRLGARPPEGEGEDVVATTYEQVARASFPAAFHRFAIDAAGDYGEAIRPVAAVAAGRSRRGAIAALAVHYVRPLLPSSGPATVAVRFPRGRGAALASLTYELQAPVAGARSHLGRLIGRVSRDGRSVSFSVPAKLWRNPRFARPLLVISNGSSRPIRYLVTSGG